MCVIPSGPHGFFEKFPSGARFFPNNPSRAKTFRTTPRKMKRRAQPMLGGCPTRKFYFDCRTKLA